MAKGMADRHPLLCVCSVFVGLILRSGVQIRLYIFGFLGPLGLDSGRFTTPFLKCVSSNFSKKTNNPNPSPIKKIWFGLYLFGAGGRTRTGTPSLAVDFESTTSTIPSHRQLYFQISTPKSFLGKRRAKPEGNSKNATYSLPKSAGIPREIPHAGGFGEPDFESTSSTNSNTPAGTPTV